MSGARPVRVGFVGTGWMGTTMLRRLTEHPGAEVVAVFEPNEPKARDALVTVGATGVSIASRYEELVEDRSIDAVFLCGPNGTHGPQSIAALEAEKHVFCEKPPSIRFDEHLRQVELARAAPHLVTYVDYILYFDQFEQRLRQMVADGAFGTVTQIQVNYRHAINTSGDRGWKLQRSVMGDAIGMGINHSISVMLFAMQSQAKPAVAYATSLRALNRPFEAHPVWNIQVTFDNGACGFLFGDIDSRYGYDAFHSLQGTSGALAFDSFADDPRKVRQWVADGRGADRDGTGHWIDPLDAERCRADGVTPWPEGTTTPDSGNVLEHQTGEAVAHFIECVQAGTPSPLGFDGAAEVAEVGWAAQISAVTGEAVPLPLDVEHALAVIRRNPGSFA